MRHTKYIAPLAAAAALTGAVGTASTASAAVGGGHQKNPGIVALMDDNGNHLCTGVLVASQWVLTDEGSLPCNGSSVVTGDTLKNGSHIDGTAIPFPVDGWGGNDPRKSGAKLLHLDKPLTNVTPARLSDTAPKAGEALKIVSFNGPEGINHALSIGQGTFTAKGHNAWASYYGAGKGMTLEGPVDNGSAVMRGDAVVGFTQVSNPRGVNAEDISHIHAWLTKVTGAK